MIVFHLRCEKSHEFEAWFSSSAAFEDQLAAGLVTCPECASTDIAKAPMAPALAGARKDTLNEGERKKLRRFAAGLRQYVKDNADYVGKDFPEEARKIHYGESEDRPIYGEASLAEAQALIEEGVSIAALPPDPEEEIN